MEHIDIAIIGGGLAGAVTAENYRKSGGEGSVTIFSRESTPPVHRPPLSKEYLRGDEALEKVYVHGRDFYQDAGIALRLDSKVESLELHRNRFQLSNGDEIQSNKLVLATGARPRRLAIPGSDLSGLHYLRSLQSAQALQKAYAVATRAVIVGAGFIGMEVAATLTQEGIPCTVIEAGPRIWQSLVPETTARFIQHRFEARGVQFRFNVGVAGFAGTRSVEKVLLASGEALETDLVVVGVGAIPNTELARDAGLQIDNGVIVDAFFRTSQPDVYAVGDIARFPDPVEGSIRLEHWDNAAAGGRALGKTLAGAPEEFRHVAYFFSDLFDLSLNMIGYPAGWDDAEFQGNLAEGTFTTLYLKGGTVSAALMINDDAKLDHWTEVVAQSSESRLAASMG